MTQYRVSRALGALALLLGGIIAGLLIAEAIARLMWRDPEPPAHARDAGPHELRSSAELMQPNVQGIYNGATYRTNSAGFRGREYTRRKPPDVFRIVVVGDSFTMGSGVRDDEAYPALLETPLNRPGERPYEVLNLGMIGFSLNDVVNRLIKLGLPFQPDLIVYGCTLNDINGPAYRSSRTLGSWFEQQARYNRFHDSRSYLLRVAWPHWQSVHDLFRPEPGTYTYELLDNYLHNPRAWADFLAGLDRLAAVAATAKVPVVVFIHTSLEYLNFFHPYQGIYGRIAHAAEERGMRVVHSFPALRGHDEESLWVNKFDPHPNATAHRLMAGALVKALAP